MIPVLLPATRNFNMAEGFGALFANSSGQENTAIGNAALANNPPGNFNTANGAFALYDNNTGTENTATGRQALAFSKRSYNMAMELMRSGSKPTPRSTPPSVMKPASR